MREIATVRTLAPGVFRKPVSMTGIAAAWVAETAARPETIGDPGPARFPAAELYAIPAATQTLLDDAYVDLDEWLAEEVQHAFAAQETTAFVSGDGVNKPKGFLSYARSRMRAMPGADLGFIAVGVGRGLRASSPTDKLIDLIYAPKTQYRPNGRFVMNRSTVQRRAQVEGRRWQLSGRGDAAGRVGEPAGLSGHRDRGHAGHRGELLRDRVRRLREGLPDRRSRRRAGPARPVFGQADVLFYTTKRVGGGVQNFDAIKLMKFAAS